MGMRLVPVVLFVVGFYFALGNITITELKVPTSISNEEPPDNVTLDCVFEASGKDNIVVKWFFNTTENMIYQWIPPKEPIALGMFKGIVDKSFRVTEDRTTMHRALHITQISPNITGRYYCKVSGDHSEALVAKKMVVYEPPENGLETEHDKENNTITCSSYGLSPEPEISFCVRKDNESECDEDFFSPVVHATADDDNRFNITGYVVYNETLLQDGDIIYCNLTIPDTDYSIEERIEYHSETFELDEETADYPAWFYEIDSTDSANITDDNDEGNVTNVSSEQDNSAGSTFLSWSLVLTIFLPFWLKS